MRVINQLIALYYPFLYPVRAKMGNKLENGAPARIYMYNYTNENTLRPRADSGKDALHELILRKDTQ